MSCPRGCCASYREHLLSISISAAATPTRSGNYRQTQDLADQWERDIPAYKRLVKGGVQPDTVDGAADLEKQVDAHHGQVVNVE